tara:strand:+ start:182 stop:616 length:435 start_codon:yes stop_codon:yes gene_type:complete
MQYQNYRIKSPVKSFRDLFVYQKTVQLSDEITTLPFLDKEMYEKDKEQLKEIAENIPKLIAEAYGDKFDSKELAHKKITEAITLITNIITKLDLLRQRFSENQEAKDILDKLLTNYRTQKIKVLHLRKAWDRVFPNKNGPTKNN